MKIIKITKSKFPYAVIYWNGVSVNKQHESFKTVLEACNFAMTQVEYIESCDGSIVDWVTVSKHPIQYKGGWREFVI